MAARSIRPAEKFLSFRKEITEMRHVFSFISFYRITYDPFRGNKKKMFSSVVLLENFRSREETYSAVNDYRLGRVFCLVSS